MKKGKTIIGFVGDSGVGKTTAANILSSKGFFKASIMSKVEEIARHIASPKEIANNKSYILGQIRKRGLSVCKEYWVNLVLITVPDHFDFIVFDDILMEESVSDKIKIYQICRPCISSIVIPNVETIENNGTLREFTAKIESVYKKISRA